MIDYKGPDQSFKGFVIVSVLWLLALLTTIAIGLTYVARQSTSSVIGLAGGTEARYLADGGTQLVIANLMANDQHDRLLADGVTIGVSLPGGQVQVTVYDESGKIDINYAREATLTRLITSIGIKQETAQALASAIGDYRDEDDDRRNNGAEEEDYQAAGLARMPKNDRFTAVEELQNVYGMTPDIYAAILPLVTVYGYQIGINPEVAPLQVLLALSEDSEQSVSAYVERRRSNHRDRTSPPEPPTIDRKLLARKSRYIYAISASAETEQGRTGGTTTVVQLRRSRINPSVKTLDWQPFFHAPAANPPAAALAAI